ncbi:hypothetical protein [Paenibacillus kribbensis]|uniref:hypothetical protein n=1 Tax=Paenibacillus kribbensis TaxID=172713 RepID=UPI0008387DCB|nr:hypothetical protein [Paenibacillus kribbensis]
MDGWISLHRKLIESEIWEKPPLYAKVWIYLLLSAQHTQYKGLKKGQVLTSIPEIIDAVSWKVGARRERPTKDQIYQVLEFLRGKAMKSKRSPDESNAKATMITTTKATHKLLITISNFGVYQDLKSGESNDESNDEKATKPPRKQRQPNNINNNDNNDNNEQQGKDKKPPSPKSPKRTYSEEDRVYKLAKRFHELAYQNALEIGTDHLIESPNFQKWANTFRLMIEKQKLQEAEIGEVVKFALSDSFYRTIIFSPDNLRKQYQAILTKMRIQGGGGRGQRKASYSATTQTGGSYESPTEDLILGKSGSEEEPVSEELLQRIRST